MEAWLRMLPSLSDVKADLAVNTDYWFGKPKSPSGREFFENVAVASATVADLSGRLRDCKTLIWNGPLGAFEIKPFDFATNALAREAAKLTADGELLSIAGGGDTVAALVNAGVSDKFSYVSMAGGAFLQWLEGKELPGVAALKGGG